jgi:uncharacterized damage-inducible protein DinB
MEQTYALLAEYNAYANGLLLGVLDKAPPELLTKDAGSWYRSILGLLNHIMRSELGWLARFKATPGGFTTLASPAAAFDPATAPQQLYDNFADLAKRRRELDALFVAFAAELTEEVLDKEVRYVNSKGDLDVFVLRDILLHVFNHQTHHRGQVSQILDAAKVEHDFSNISTVLRLRRAKK